MVIPIKWIGVAMLTWNLGLYYEFMNCLNGYHNFIFSVRVYSWYNRVMTFKFVCLVDSQLE